MTNNVQRLRDVHPVIHIERDLENGEYRVQPYTEGPVATTAFGESIVIAPIDFESRIADAVIAALEKFGKEKYDEKMATRRTASEQRNYLKRHLQVSVRRDPKGQLTVRPLHRERGGWVGYDEDTLFLSEFELREKLPDVLREAFRRAT